MSAGADTLRRGLALTLERTDLSGLGPKVEGKVRDSYLPGDGTRVLVTTDRISAFDRVLGTLPFKGQVLNQLSAWWFDRTKDVAPNHFRAMPDPSVTVAIECEPLPVEWVVRAYLTGVTSTSVWTHYARGEREFCGHRLPEGLKKNEPLPAPILTPSTKAEKGGHDESVSRAAHSAVTAARRTVGGVVTSSSAPRSGATASGRESWPSPSAAPAATTSPHEPRSPSARASRSSARGSRVAPSAFRSSASTR